ncbi:MAG: type I phosphomannose isomerase catalytic subunit [Verrucomicrobiota bacterium]
MTPGHPLKFHPRLMERVWGGRRLATVFGRPVPPGKAIGESWEISDRPGEESVVAEGPWRGRSLRDLMRSDREWLLGRPGPAEERFPWLAKLLDAREDLSLQVHPPASRARELGGEPKTELWWVAAAEPGARLYAGLQPGVTREEFTRRSHDGTVAACFHQLPVQAGDALFLPSGRVHALGRGLVIFEIQQNSDTTYRVFDWNRPGLDGRPRPLHLEPALASIDFTDVAPSLLPRTFEEQGGETRRVLVRDPLFDVDHVRAGPGLADRRPPGTPALLAVVQGCLAVEAGRPGEIRLGPGDFCLLPAALKAASLHGDPGTEFLRVTVSGDTDHGNRGQSTSPA